MGRINKCIVFDQSTLLVQFFLNCLNILNVLKLVVKKISQGMFDKLKFHLYNRNYYKKMTPCMRALAHCCNVILFKDFM